METAKIDRTKEWTVADYLMLGETNTPCQLIRGELYMSPSPAPYHQLISGNLFEIFRTESKKTRDLVFFSPLDLYIDNKNVYQPDLVYILNENKSIITSRGVEGAPDIVVEIISPSNIFLDRNIKKQVYQKIGVRGYWIVDPANKTLEIYLADQHDPDVPHLYIAGEGKVTSTVIASLEFDLKSIF